MSWRVHLLPFLEETELYQQFHLDEPWDSPHNRELIAQMPDVFRSDDISLNLAGKTRFLLPIAEETPWHGPVGAMIREITDGTSNTIMILEADHDRAVVWTEPADLTIDWDQVQDGLAVDGAGFHATFCDGSAHLIRADIDSSILTRLLKHADGEIIGQYDIHPQN